MGAYFWVVVTSVALAALSGGCAQVTQPVSAAYQANPSDPPDIAAAKADQRAAVAAVRAGDRTEATRLFMKADKEMQDARIRMAQPSAEKLQELREYDAKGDAGVVGHDANNWMNSPDSLASAREQIGEYYENGWAVTRDYATAAHWYQKALDTPGADHIRQKAAFHLAMLYERGGPNLLRDHAKSEQILASNHMTTTQMQAEAAAAEAERERAQERYIASHPTVPNSGPTSANRQLEIEQCKARCWSSARSCASGPMDSGVLGPTAFTLPLSCNLNYGACTNGCALGN